MKDRTHISQPTTENQLSNRIEGRVRDGTLTSTQGKRHAAKEGWNCHDRQQNIPGNLMNGSENVNRPGTIQRVTSLNPCDFQIREKLEKDRGELHLL